MEARFPEDGTVLGPGDAVGGLVAWRPISVLLDTPLPDIAEVMSEESIGVVLVRGPHGPIGIVSERDLTVALAESSDPTRDRARDFMTADLASIDAHQSILAAADAMLANEIRHLVVTAEGSMTGLVSMRDVLRVLATHAARITGQR
jgi:CBS domain-containing protein